MKFFKYTSSCIINALVAAVVGILTVLVGNESGSMIGAGIAAGISTALATAVSFPLGKVKQAAYYTDDNGAQMLSMAIVGALFGFLGAWSMGL